MKNDCYVFVVRIARPAPVAARVFDAEGCAGFLEKQAHDIRRGCRLALLAVERTRATTAIADYPLLAEKIESICKSEPEG